MIYSVLPKSELHGVIAPMVVWLSNINIILNIINVIFRSELVYPLCFVEYKCTTSQGEYLSNEYSLVASGSK